MGKTICLFGDSITWGSWDPQKGGWGSRLRTYFETNDIEVNVFNCGISWDNTNGLLQRFKVEAIARKPNIIIFAIGINDSQYVNTKDNPRVPIEQFQNNLKKLAKQASKIADKTIFVGLTKVDESRTMPVAWNATRFYEINEVSKYNLTIKMFCQNNKLAFIDMSNRLKDKDLEDGLHPNASGHKKMFDTIKNFLIDNKIV